MYLNLAQVWLEHASRQDAKASSARLPPAPRLKRVIRRLTVGAAIRGAMPRFCDRFGLRVR